MTLAESEGPLAELQRMGLRSFRRRHRPGKHQLGRANFAVSYRQRDVDHMLRRSGFATPALFRSAGLLCICLALAWLLAPRALLDLWRVDADYAATLVSRRCGALFVGIGITLWLARNAADNGARRAICTGLAVSCAALAILGIYEFAAGQAGPLIWPAIAVEGILAVLFAISR